MTIERKQVTTRTFDSTTGTLIEAGGFILIDTKTNPLKDEKVDKDNMVTPGNSPNLRDPSTETILMPVVVAPIAPTGPNPTMPQQIPPGAVQTANGYTMDGAALVPEGGAIANAIDDGEYAIEEGGKPIESTPKKTTAKTALS